MEKGIKKKKKKIKKVEIKFYFLSTQLRKKVILFNYNKVKFAIKLN